MSTVSIIIACFNDGKYLLEAVASAKRQSYLDTQIIVVDDGSTERYTLQILQQLKKNSICVLHTSHIGPAGARNIGIEKASGDYILPLDADDIIEPTYVEKAVSIMEKDPHMGIVYCRADKFGLVSGEWMLPKFSIVNMLVGNLIFVTALFRKVDWIAVKGFSDEFVHGLEDYDFWLSILEMNRNVFQIQEILFHYRIRHSSRSMRMDQDRDKLIANNLLIYEKHRALYNSYAEQLIWPLKEMMLAQDITIREFVRQRPFYERILRKITGSIKIRRK